MQRVEHVVRDPRADHREQRRGRHREPEPERRRVGLLEGVAVLERLHEHGRLAGQEPVDDEGGRVLDEDAALAELLRHVPGGRERHVVGRRRAHELDEREHRDRVEEVHPDDALRVLRARAAISATDSDDVFVTSRHSSETTASSAAKTSLLDGDLLEDGLDHEVAAARTPTVSATPLTIEPRKRALPSPSRPRDDLLLEIGADRRDGLLDARRVDIGDHERHLEPAQEQRRELGRHQARPDDADLLDPPRLRLGDPDALLDPPLDEVERVHPGLRLRAGQEVGERVLLGGVALLDRPARRCRRSARARGTGRARRRARRRRRRSAPWRRPRPRRRGRRPRAARVAPRSRARATRSSRRGTRRRRGARRRARARPPGRRAAAGSASAGSRRSARPPRRRRRGAARAGCRPSRG